MKTIGILGGTFDPPHWGHIIIAEDLCERFSLDRMLLVPAFRAPHKRDRAGSSPSQRLAMLRAAVKGRGRLGVSDIEIRRGGVSYTIDTIRALSKPGVRLVFFAGTDSIAFLPKWREIDSLVRECTFVLMKRPGFDMKKLDAIKGRLKPATFRAIISRAIEVRQIDISSTEIRRRAQRGLNVSHLVPPPVTRYIEKHQLY
jgi:nicotinate-nucleotide adenylyltransferase